MTQLYRHQEVGIQELCDHELLGLWDDTGLGKTLQVICALRKLLTCRAIDAALVVCKHAHVGVWKKQLAQYAPDLITSIRAGLGPIARLDPWPEAHVYVINYELLQRMPNEKNARGHDFVAEIGPPYQQKIYGPDAQHLMRLLTSARVAMVLDESHAIKSHTTAVTRVLCALGRYAARRYLMTGTPAAERPDDLWSQILFLDHGHTLGTSYFRFIQHYAVFATSRGRRWIRSYANLPHLRKRIEHLYIRRTKEECLDLPPRVFDYPTLTCPPTQGRLLGSLRGEMVQALRATGQRYISLQPGTSFAALYHKMQSVAAVPIEQGALIPAAKYDYLMELLSGLPDTEQVIVWTIHRDVAMEIATRLQGDGITASHIHGGLTHKEREHQLDQFCSGQTRIICATMASLREAVTLTNAAYAVYAQIDFSLVNWKQSLDRNYRIGTNRTTFVYVPLVDGSLDGFIAQRIQQKQADVEVVADGKSATVHVSRASLLSYLTG